MKRSRRPGVVFAVLATVFGLALPTSAQATNKFLIYLVTWHGCEEACEGFKSFIANSGVDAKVLIRTADRDAGKLPAFVEEARALKADAMVTYGTSVTRGIAGTLSDHGAPRFIDDIPLVFMVVADPIGSDIIESYEKTGRNNVTGTRNRVPEAVNIATIRAYYPAFKRLGVLYNTNENNSVIKVREMESLATQLDFELVALELELEPDGKPAPASIPVRIADLAAAGVDFIYLGSSSFLDINRDLFTQSAVNHGIPVLSPYERLVRNSHALLSIAARYQDVGALAGRQVKSILVDGKKPGDLPVLSVEQYAYVVNMTTAKKLRMFPSVEILQIAETVQ
jgi:putative ABC transport system substrate-binding protein